MAKARKFMFHLIYKGMPRVRAVFAPDEKTAREWFILLHGETIVRVREAGTGD